MNCHKLDGEREVGMNSFTQAVDRRQFLLAAATASGVSLARTSMHRATAQERSSAAGEASELKLGRELWSVPVQLHASRFQPDGGEQNVGDVVGLSPQLWKSVLLVQDASGLRGLDLSSGKSAWPSGEEDLGFLLESDRFQVERSGTQNRFRGLIADDKWIGCLNQKLIALDLRGEGKIDWVRRVEELVEDERSRSFFTGAPVSAGTNLFVPAHTASPGMRSRLIALNRDGRVNWRTGPVSHSAGESAWFQDELAVLGETLFWNLDGKLLLAIEVGNGRILWQTSLSVPSIRTRNPANQRRTLLHAEQGALIALDGRTVMRIDPQSGGIHWRREVDFDVSAILGIRNQSVVLSGQQVCARHLENGEAFWKTDVPGESRAASAAMLIGDEILWGGGQELWSIDALTGHVDTRQHIPQRVDDALGALAFYDDKVLFVGADELTCFSIQANDQR